MPVKKAKRVSAEKPTKASATSERSRPWCHAIACLEHIDNYHTIFCEKHWKMVPKFMRGQLQRHEPSSPKWLAKVLELRNYVFELEQDMNAFAPERDDDDPFQHQVPVEKTVQHLTQRGEAHGVRASNVKKRKEWDSIPFGMHKGVPLEEVPTAYLEWCVGNLEDTGNGLFETIEMEYQGRLDGTRPRPSADWREEQRR